MGIGNAGRNGTSQLCDKFINSGQFYVRFEFGTPAVRQRDKLLVHDEGMFTATYHVFLFEECLALCRKTKPKESPLWTSRIIGIIDFRRGRLMKAYMDQKRNSLASPLHTMIFEWTGLDGKPYKIALAPCDNLENGRAICKSWISAMERTEFRNGVHNWPLMREEQVS
jgi:hypothetical protein